MKILMLSGSTRTGSSNQQLMEAIAADFPQYDFVTFPDLADLPLFRPDDDKAPWPASVKDWRSTVHSASALIITTPAYLENLPALLKNALEWLTTSGELSTKPVLPITFTPHAPRGEHAMQSLLWSLGALDARIVAALPLYQNEMEKNGPQLVLPTDVKEMLAEALVRLTGG